MINPRSELAGNFRNFREISGKFQGNFTNSINSNNNDTHIDPNSGSEPCGNFRNFREISGKFHKLNQF